MEIPMAKYKKVDPAVVEGFLSKMFGRIATQVGKDVVKDMGKKDPGIVKKLNRISDLIADVEKDLKGKTKAQQDKYHRDLWKKAGI